MPSGFSDVSKLTLKKNGPRVWDSVQPGLVIDRPNQVCAADVTYIRLAKGFLYLVAIIDWFSRKVLAWELAKSMAGKVRWSTTCLSNASGGVCSTKRYLKGYASVAKARTSISHYLDFLNQERRYQSLNRQTPNTH